MLASQFKAVKYRFSARPSFKKGGNLVKRFPSYLFLKENPLHFMCFIIRECKYVFSSDSFFIKLSMLLNMDLIFNFSNIIITKEFIKAAIKVGTSPPRKLFWFPSKKAL